jgi:Ca-activated chloride channel family protein
MTFGAPGWLWVLALLPVFVLLYVRAERASAARLSAFIAAKLVPELAGTVNRFRRALRLALLLVSLGCALIALAQPRWGYTYEEAKRKGLDLILAVDTSRSMLSNDVPPNRLERVKLATQDFINELQGDRVGLIAFAGRAFLQAPLTIDYSAAVDAINDLDTNTIPEGGTNISEAINLAVSTFGKSATGNRALVIFTDGEELSGDATKTAKAAADAGVRIFTVGVGTPEGSLIPLPSQGGGAAFVKDSKGQVVKSKLDENRLREVAQETGGTYLHLENGPATMKQLAAEGLAKMQVGDIDARLSRRPIERYQWPLGAGCIALAGWFLISERKRSRATAVRRYGPRPALATAAVLLISSAPLFASAPGLDAYRNEKFQEAYGQFQQTLKEHPQASATDKLQFDSGAAAYKMKDYNKALDSFSQALLSPDKTLQSRSHYNLGNTLYERGESQKADNKKLSDWTNALQHYDETLKAEPQNKEAKENYEFVKNRIEELKRKHEQQPSPTPTPSPQPQNKNKQDDKKQDKQQQSQQQDKNQQQQNQNSQKDNQKQDESKNDQEKNKSDQKKPDQNKDAKGSSPTPSPSSGEHEDSAAGPSPSASPSATAGEQPQNPQNEDQQPSPSPGDQPQKDAEGSPSPSPEKDSGAEPSASPTAAPSVSPGKNLSGDVKGAPQDKSSDQAAELAEAEPQQEGQMSEKQAELLLKSLKDEEQRVQLDERKAARHVYNDW